MTTHVSADSNCHPSESTPPVMVSMPTFSFNTHAPGSKILPSPTPPGVRSVEKLSALPTPLMSPRSILAHGMDDGSPRELRDPTLAPWEQSRTDDISVERAVVYGAQRLTRTRGVDLMRDPFLNKGTAFNERERDLLKLRGLIPPKMLDIETQMVRTKANFDKAPSDIARYLILERLHNRNETLYYRFLLENIQLTMPIVYTPTVGQACLDFSDMYRSRVRGLFFSKNERQYFRDIVRNWPQHEVDIIVVTDGSRILGLGDLGLCGMGIPIGKLSLYVASAGFKPWRTLPITIDVGTNNETFLNSDTYIGLSEKRPDDKEFYEILDDFMREVRWRWPKCLVHFEDFSSEHAFGLLEKYRHTHLCFNDDIQGTGAVTLAGILAGMRVQRVDGGPQPKLRDQVILVLGSGSAGVGVAEAIAQGMMEEARADGIALDIDAVRKTNFFLMDTKGLVTDHRGDVLTEHKIPYARGSDTPNMETMLEVVQIAHPTVLLGLAGIGPAFDEELISQMTKNSVATHNLRPVIMALSNPTSMSECTAEQAYRWSDCQAIFASGSPFDPVTIGDKHFAPGQGNNMYIFPGMGLGAVSCQAKRVTDKMFYEAARRLSLLTSDEDLAVGQVYPSLNKIRHISAVIAKGLCEVAVKDNLAQVRTPPEGWFKRIKSQMWWPEYEDYV